MFVLSLHVTSCRPFVRVVTAGLALAAVLTGLARAQEIAEPAASSEAFAVDAAQFGLGGAARLGSWAPIRVVFENRTDRDREVILGLSIRDEDGDRVVYERPVTAARGVAQSSWLYMRVPHSLELGGAVLTVSEAEERATADGAEFVAGARLAARVVPATALTPSQDRLIAVVGARSAGLGAYAARAADDLTSPMGHAPTRVLTGLGVSDLPDRWQGFAALEALVWSDGDLGAMRADTARALAEWVRRGGHLILGVPTEGDSAFARAPAVIRDVLPEAEYDRRDGVDLNPMRALLTTDAVAPLPGEMTLHTLRPDDDASPAGYLSLLKDPSSRTVAARRLVGVGMVTVVGFDLASPRLAEAAVPRPEAFWHRVLGRRAPTSLPADPAAQAAAARRPGGVFVDDAISSRVARRAAASSAVLIAAGVFVVYWALAGPGGFALLKLAKRTHLAWVAFILTGGVFTLLAWTSAAVFRPKGIEVTHFTVLTHVSGQPVQAARSWQSVLIPYYGRATVEVGEADGRAGQLIAPWEPRERSGRSARFPDAASYRVDARSPRELDVPARQTVKQFVTDWAGVTPWGVMPRPVDDETIPALGDPSLGPFAMTGRLVHGLPAALEDAVVVVCRGQENLGRELAGGRSGENWAVAGAFELSGDFTAWAPGRELDLASVTGRRSTIASGDSASTLGELLERLTPTARLTDALDLTGDRLGLNDRDRVRAVLLQGMLDPAEVRGVQPPNEVGVLGAEMHGLDLSRWLAQPSLIIFGFVREDGVERGPVPLHVNGETPQTAGETVLCWVYPLEADAPGYALPLGMGTGVGTAPVGGVPETPSETGSGTP
ncbi:MAG: hypothetical protein AAGG07_05480 [Planctomycetota bacterium]